MTPPLIRFFVSIIVALYHVVIRSFISFTHVHGCVGLVLPVLLFVPHFVVCVVFNRPRDRLLALTEVSSANHIPT
jgi:hypothetical protein